MHIFVSGTLMELVSSDVKALFRCCDVVNLKGSKREMYLYTYDMKLDKLY